MIEWSDVDLCRADSRPQSSSTKRFGLMSTHWRAATWSRIRSSGSCSPPSESARWRSNRSTNDWHACARIKRTGRTARAPKSGGMFGDGGSAGMGFVLVSELCRVSMGLVTGMGVSLGLTVPTIASWGTLAQQERWLPDLVTYDKVGAGRSPNRIPVRMRSAG